jgi:deoxycytidylate deaminase
MVFVYPVLVGSEDNESARTSNCRREHYMELASKEAQKSYMSQQHGCVIVLDNEIISVGHNRHTKQMFHCYSIHAEVDALSKINKKKYKTMFSKMEMYVVRIGKGIFSETLKYSKPCEGCEAAITKYGVQKVFYSTNWEYEEILKAMQQRQEKGGSL